MTEKNILVVDTDSETTLRIKTVLESEGYTVYNTSGRLDSLSLAKKILPSLVFINIAMRDVSGLEIAKAIHDTDILSTVPIIVITPHGGTVEPRYTTMYGIVDFLKKAFSSEELISKVIDLTEMKPAETTTDEHEFVIPVEDDSPKMSPEPEPEATEPVEMEIPLETTAYSESPAFSSVLSSEQEKVSATEEIPLKEIGETEDTGVKSDDRIPENEIKSAEFEPAEKTLPPDAGTADEPAVDYSDEPRAEKKAEAKSIALIAAIIFAFIALVGAGIYVFTSFSKKTEVVSVAPPKPVQQQIPSPEPSPGQPNPLTQTEKPAEAVKEQPPVAEKQKDATTSQKSVREINKADKPSVKHKTPEKVPAVKEVKKRDFAYSVQLGVFKNESNANALAKKFSGNKHEAFVQKTSGKNNSVLYRVLTGRFENRKDAEQLAKKIASGEKIQAVVFKHSGK